MTKAPFGRFMAACAASTAIAIITTSLSAGAVGRFGDVEGHEFYADAVQWMVDENLTTGTSPGCFSPHQPMTRGELATFFWRYADTPDGGSHPFADVSPTTFYADAVGWMYSSGVTNGTSPTTFSPQRVITRGEVAAFMWRYEGSPGATLSPFFDVPSTAFYATAVGWMTTEGITSGTSATTFSPSRELTRAEFATFFYRWAGSPPVRDSGGGTCIATGQSAGALFFEDFVAGDSVSRFEFDIYHRDDHVIDKREWAGDHAVTGPNDECGPPEDKRTITRGERSQDFNNDWIYRCVPGGDTTKAHLMTSIGDTSGYSIGAFTPAQTFTGVREIRWDINLTELGIRQFPEVKVIPADTFDFQDLPCTIDWLPCGTGGVEDVGGVSTSFMNHILWIHNGTAAVKKEDFSFRRLNPEDPALNSIRIRRQNFFRDNGDGTLTFGIETEDGSFQEHTTAGSFPQGDVRVVFADHNYTPHKDNAPSFTWHWDNITIHG